MHLTSKAMASLDISFFYVILSYVNHTDPELQRDVKK